MFLRRAGAKRADVQRARGWLLLRTKSCESPSQMGRISSAARVILHFCPLFLLPSDGPPARRSVELRGRAFLRGHSLQTRCRLRRERETEKGPLKSQFFVGERVGSGSQGYAFKRHQS